MKLNWQISLFFALCLLGEWVVGLLPIPFPSSVIGMIFLFLLLISQRVKVKDIGSFSQFIMENMAMFFIPSAVSLMNNVPLLREILFPFLGVVILSTLLTFAATGYTVMVVSKYLQKRKESHE